LITHNTTKVINEKNKEKNKPITPISLLNDEVLFFRLADSTAFTQCSASKEYLVSVVELLSLGLQLKFCLSLCVAKIFIF